MDTKVNQFIQDCTKSCFDFITPSLNNFSSFNKELSRVIKTKVDENIQYSFDVQLDELIKLKLKDHGITGRIFSEESGFFELGEKKYRVVYDPFCNSSLASRGFREAAMGISVFSWDYVLISSAVLDYQTGLVGVVIDDKTEFHQVHDWEKLVIDRKDDVDLKSAWVVVTLENRRERSSISRVNKLLGDAGRILISSGHIFWLRLATGTVDAYLDPIGGEKLYEMFAATVAQKSGCIVTDVDGKLFDASGLLKTFDNDPGFIYYPVAATNSALHNELLFPTK